MAYISGKYTSATSYTVTLDGMKIGMVYAILVQDLNTDGSSNGFICKWKSGATSSTNTVKYTTTAAYSQYDRRIGFFQGSFETNVGTTVSDANFEKWADGKGVISAWNGGGGGGGSTTYTIGVNANGGTYSGPTPTVSSTYPYLSLTAISNSTSRNGYKLTGWLWSVDGTIYSTTATISGISSSGTLTAQWERTSVTITLDAKEGVFQDTRQHIRSITNQTPGDVFYFKDYSSLVTRDGYEVIGWSASSSVTTPTYDKNGYVSIGYTNATYYAVWQKSVATITLYGNGGLWGGNLQKRTLTKNVGETVSFAEYGPNGTPPLQYAYHTLAGWGTSATGTAAWDPNGYVTVGATDANYYAIWKNHIDPFYWDGSSGSSDGSIIAVGLPLSNLTASRWNRLMATLAELAAGNGSSFIYSPVAAGSRITAAGFNAVRAAIASQPGHGATPGARSAGDSILASYYNGVGSLKNALNSAIIYYNNR
jgi:hypothetical protein